MIEHQRVRRPPATAGLSLHRRTSATVAAVLALSLSLIAASRALADDTAAAKGARVYDKYCATCHGDDLQNNTGVAFDLRRLRTDEHARFVNSVLHGKKAMPSWQGVLAPEQLEELWAYIRKHAYQR